MALFSVHDFFLSFQAILASRAWNMIMAIVNFEHAAEAVSNNTKFLQLWSFNKNTFNMAVFLHKDYY